ncbi:hypothetical protein SLEP1_g25120 [Rubroshorea leprosula]|uniref:Retrotransposon gag domain-containing protein n=1 Tax=Rubroshorea leprosula TaxID=152421 RepID=A0AAV5JKZ2_9ROSI|nr:hypothetical protein SLEP1_g25120 [Rubroshorea leprosula]
MVNTRSVRAGNSSQPLGRAPQQNPEPVQHPPALSESQGQSHIAPAQPPLPDDLETYDGTKDPDDHLHAFYSCMQAQNASDALMCKIFPSTLRGNARTWYYSLPPKLISSYTEMASAFATKFSNRRFNDAVLEVSSFDQAVGIAAVISSLNHERFRDSLIKHAATTFNEVNDRKRMRIAQNRGSMPTSTSRFGRPNSTPPQQSPGGLEAGGMSSKQKKLYVREVKHLNRAQKRKIDDADWKEQPITFTPVDFEGVVTPHNDPLVISIMINNCQVQRVLVDTGSALDIMYYHCFESLRLNPALLQRYDGPIYGFNNQPVPVEGVLTMNVAFGSGRKYVTPSVRFLVVKMASSFNVVIGKPTLTEIRAMVSQSHLCMKFPTPLGVATLRGNQEVARHCYLTSVTRPQKDKDQPAENPPQEIHDNRQVMGVEILDNRPEDET